MNIFLQLIIGILSNLICMFIKYAFKYYLDNKKGGR